MAAVVKSVTCYASGSRTATPTAMGNKSCGPHKGIQVVVDTTVIPGSAPSNVVKIQGYDPLSGKYYNLLTSDPITAVGTVIFRVYPGLIPSTLVSTNGLLAIGTLAKDATAEKFKTTTTAIYFINGVVYAKPATTALVFTANHVVTASKFAVILVQINTAGTISTKVPGSPQTYNDAPTALAALPSPDSGNVALGYIAIAAKAATWTANTDDLTNASDLTTAALTDGSLISLANATLTTVNDTLPPLWRVIVESGNANSATYSVGANLLL